MMATITIDNNHNNNDIDNDNNNNNINNNIDLIITKYSNFNMTECRPVWTVSLIHREK